MIAAPLALLLYAMPPPKIEGVRPEVVEVRVRRRHRSRKPAAAAPIDPSPRRVPTFTVLEGPDGKRTFLPGPAGIEDVYSRVPPFNGVK